MVKAKKYIYLNYEFILRLPIQIYYYMVFLNFFDFVFLFSYIENLSSENQYHVYLFASLQYTYSRLKNEKQIITWWTWDFFGGYFFFILRI